MAEFRFKQFTVRNESAAMKVGTDGVLLGAWTDYHKSDRKVLDVGTGTGVIALIAAQRLSALGADTSILAIDIDTDAVSEASFNFERSPWPDLIESKQISIQDLSDDSDYFDSFDLIVSNPPFFEESLKASDLQRSVARHTDTLSYEDLIRSAGKLLKAGGRLSIILPFDAVKEIRFLSVENCFRLSRITAVKTTPIKEPKRVLMELVKTTGVVETKNSELVIQSAAEYSEDYIYLVCDLLPKI